MVRIAFTLIGGRAWAGGYNYLSNLLTGLGKFCSGKVQPVFSGLFGPRILLYLLFKVLKSCWIVLLNHVCGPCFVPWSLSDFRIKRLLMTIDVDLRNVNFWLALVFPRLPGFPICNIAICPFVFAPSWWKRELGFAFKLLPADTLC